MIVDWPALAVALVFGLLSPLRLLSSGCRFLTFQEMWTRVWRRAPAGQRRRRWWKLPLVWIDPVRGYVVGHFLGRAFGSSPESSYLEAQVLVALGFVALFAIVWVQTKGRKGERESLSPAGFMAGLMLAVLEPPIVAVSAWVVGGAMAIALDRYSFGYWAAALTVLMAGAVFSGVGPALVLQVGLVSAPAWIAWLRRTPLVTPVRC
jgi:hypothetical protein